MSGKKLKCRFVFDPSSVECRNFIAVSLKLEDLRRDFCDRHKLSFHEFEKSFHELCKVQTELLCLFYDSCLEELNEN